MSESAQKEEIYHKQKELPAVLRRKMLGHAYDSEEIELKLLKEEDIEDILAVLKKVNLDVGSTAKQ